jgi:large subunit ribosomal protein L18
MKDKRSSRLQRAVRTRARIRALGRPRLTVYRTPRHIYAQIQEADGSRVMASASTLNATLRAALKGGGNIAAASAVGTEIAERARKAGITQVAFDRAGYRYHGRIKALADAARAGGLEF